MPGDEQGRQAPLPRSCSNCITTGFSQTKPHCGLLPVMRGMLALELRL
jgi:hypothetical protein